MHLNSLVNTELLYNGTQKQVIRPNWTQSTAIIKPECGALRPVFIQSIFHLMIILKVQSAIVFPYTFLSNSASCSGLCTQSWLCKWETNIVTQTEL